MILQTSCVFKQKIETPTSSIKGCRDITLEYLIHVENEEHTHPTEDSVPDVFLIDFMAKNTSLKGTDFTIDNQTLYTTQRFYLTDTTRWNIISKFSKEKNGRKAFKALRERHEDSSNHDLIKTQANAMMIKPFYRGDIIKFNWEFFISIDIEAHRMFEDINEPLTESMKILFLKGGIRPEAALRSSLEVSKGLPGVNHNFDKL